MIKVPVTVSTENVAIKLGVAPNAGAVPCTANAVMSGGGGTPYEGPYDATPTMQEQTPPIRA